MMTTTKSYADGDLLHLLQVNKRLDQIIDHLQIGVEQETTYHDVKRIQCYTSNSGNKTWKAFTEERIIYLRQAHFDLLKSSGLWDDLDMMLPGDECDADLRIGTIPDGDFLKPVSIDGVIHLPHPEDE